MTKSRRLHESQTKAGVSDLAEVYAWLERYGMLVKQDRTLPNVVSILIDATLPTSWWSHPDAGRVLTVLEALAADPTILFTKLISQKDTVVGRRLSPAVCAVGMARDAWQTRSLTPEGRRLLKFVTDQGEAVAHGPAARELAFGLLVNVRQFHSSRGRHELQLESWPRWSRRVHCGQLPTAEEGRVALEAAVSAMNGATKLLPWHERRGEVRRRGERYVVPIRK